MKKTFASAVLAALFFTVTFSAQAEARGSGGHRLSVTQEGSDNSAYAMQMGRNNDGSIVQLGDDNQACLIQRGQNLDYEIVQGSGERTAVLQRFGRTREISYEACARRVLIRSGLGTRSLR